MISPDLSELVNREHLLDRIWTTLEYDSIIVTGPRRIGKTSLLRLMEHRPRPGYHVFYSNVEGIQMPAVKDRIVKSLISDSRLSENWVSLLSIGKLDSLQALPNLDEVIGRLLSRMPSDHRILLMIDEFTVLLSESDEHPGRNIFDEFRYLRMQHARLRMLFAGESVEHLGARFADLGFFNDLSVITVPKLSNEEADQLINVISKNLKIDLPQKAKREIANLADGDPFYVKSMLNGLVSYSALDLSDLSVLDIVREEAGNFREHTLSIILDATLDRIIKNYSEVESTDFFEALDALVGPHVVSLPLEDVVRHSPQNGRHVVRILEQEGILSRTALDHVSFNHELVREWWQKKRGI